MFSRLLSGVVFGLLVFSQATAVTSPENSAPLPEDVLEKLLREPYRKPTDGLAAEMARRLDETSQILRRGQARPGERDWLIQLEAQADLLKALQQPVQSRLEKDKTKAVGSVSAKTSAGKKLRTMMEGAHVGRAGRVAQGFDKLNRAVSMVLAADTTVKRNAALIQTQAVLHQLRGRFREQEEAPSSQPQPTHRLDGLSGPSPRQKSHTLPRYLSEQQSRYLKSFASNAPILLAAAPTTPIEAGQCYTAGSVDSADLAATPDVPTTDPEIIALAEKLGYSPAKVLAWVHDNIQYEPYWGSLKGAKGTLVSGAGNATDQASLMIALLRASNIPARYVSGTIQISDSTPTQPGGRALKWLGAKTYRAAASILSKGRIPAGIINNAAAQATGVYLDHVWVEACVPYTHYRGAAVSNAGHRWVPLDGSFKDRAYRQDIDVSVAFDYSFNAGSYLAVRSDELPHERYARQIEAALPADKEVADLSPAGVIKSLKLDILPVSLPYQVTSFITLTGAPSVEPAALPNQHRYVLDITVKKGAATLLTRIVDYPDGALKRLTLSFVPADAASQTWWNGWDGSYATLPAGSGSVNVTPVIKLEGTEVGGGAASATTLTGGNLTLILKLRLPDSNTPPNCVADSGSGTDPDVACVNKTVYDNIKPGAFHALQAYAFQGSDRYIKERAAQLIAAVRANPAPTPASSAAYEATLGEFLHLSLVKYLRYGQDASRQIGEQMNVAGWRGNDIGLTTVDLKTQYLFDQPYALSIGGLVIDVKGGLSRLTKLDTVSNDPVVTRNEIWPTFKLALYAGSAYEHYIWQEMARTDAVSTVRGLQFAKETGGSIVTLTSANIASYDTLMDASMAPYKSQISAYVAAGATVTAPQKTIAYVAEGTSAIWNGAVYMAENQGQGSFGALIAGNFGGGYGAPFNTPVLTNYNSQYSLFDAAIPNSLLSPTSSYFSVTGSNIFSNGNSPYISWGGDPVNLVTGNFYHVERDLSIAGRGGMPLVFERNYNSRQPKDGPLGFGWTHSFNHSLKFYGVEGGLAKVSWIDGTGGEKFFGTTAHSSGNIAANTVLTNPSGVYVSFKREASGQYTITEKNGLVYTFESVNGTTGASNVPVKLLSIADRNGNTLTATYAGGLLNDITDGAGRKLAFTYTGGRLTRLEFKKVGGAVVRTHEYTYDGSGNLTAHKSPATLADPVKNPPVSYSYYTSADGTNLDHAMQKYTLPRGNGMEFHYYADGRVFRHKTFGPGGVDLGQETTFRYNSYRRETVQVNERGLTRSFLFDEFGNPLSIVEENGARRVYTYDAARPLNRLSKTDPYGLNTQYTYDALGNVTRITQPDGAFVQFFDFNAFNQPQRIQNARGHWSLVRYDAKGNPTDDIKLRAGTAAPTANVRPADADILAWTQHSYDAYGNRLQSRSLRSYAGATLGSFTGGAGPVIATTLDANALYPVAVSRVGDKTGDGIVDANDPADVEALAFDDQGRETRGIDGDWQIVQRQFDGVDRVTRATDALGQWRDYQYDANGNPISETLVAGNAQIDSNSAQYDAADRRIQSLDAAGNASRWELDARGNPLKVTDPDGYSLGFEYDAMDRWVVAYDKQGNSVSRSLDISGRVRAVTDPNGNSTTNTWYGASKNGRLKEAIDALGRKTTYDYDPHGNPILVTDNLNQPTRTFYDALDRPVRVLAPLTNGSYPVTCMKYDTLGRVAEVWAGSTLDTTSPSCDLSGADTAIKRQLTSVYDDFGRKLKDTDPLNKTWTWSYDRFGNPTTATDPKAQTVQMTWNYGHQLATRTIKNANGTVYKTETVTRNLLGQPVQSTARDSANALILAQAFEYDPAHRPLRSTDTRPGMVVPHSRTYDWSPGGLLNQTQDEAGHRTDYLYDATGQLIGIWAPNYDYLAFSHDAGGRLTEKWFPNGTTTRYNYNVDDSLNSLTNRSAANNVLTSHVYRYDPLGRRDRHTDTTASLGTQYQQYSYDPLSRLNQVQACDSAFATCTASEVTSYDPLDNRTTRTAAGATLTHTLDAAHQLQAINDGATPKAAFVYDANGNLVQKCEGTGVTGTTTSCSGSIVTTLTWNPLDQLIAASKTGVPNETYQYDPQGRRISKTVGAVTTHYRYNGDDIDAEYSQTWNEIARYVHGAGVDDPLMRLTGATASPDAQTRYYAQNGINSIVAYFGDIAQGAAVTATSVTATNSYNASAYPPAKLIDGDTSGTSVWGGNLASGPASVTLELGAVRPVSHLTLYKANFGSSYNVKDVQVQIRNGGIWTNVGSLTNNLADNPEIVLTNASGDAIKVIIQSAQSGTAAFMAEVSMVYDGGAQTVATQRFDAWGNKTQSAGAAIPQYGYTGREPDATGLVYYRARYYDPTTGRFISRDPAGMPDGVNRYAYVGNSPINATDPMGLYAASSSGSFGGFSGGVDGKGAPNMSNNSVYPTAYSNGQMLACGPACAGVLPSSATAVPLGGAPGYQGLTPKKPTNDGYQQLFGTPTSPPPSLIGGSWQGFKDALNNPGEFLNWLSGGLVFNNGAKPPKNVEPITNPPQAPVIPGNWVSKPGRVPGSEIFYPPGSDPSTGEHIRVMPPGSSAVPGNADGYWQWINGNKQPIDPSTGKPGGRGDTHVPLPPNSMPPTRRY